MIGQLRSTALTEVTSCNYNVDGGGENCFLKWQKMYISVVILKLLCGLHASVYAQTVLSVAVASSAVQY